MKKILIGLSGGVDSAVAAHLLKQQWYEVTGGFMKNYVSDDGNCSTYQDAEEAIKVAKFLNIQLIPFDFQKEYQEKIINYLYQWYQIGITPNPDVLCNTLIKFDVFLEQALKLWFDGIATGHYARIIHIKDKASPWKHQTNNTITSHYKLLKWKDYTKDQSYFLSGLNQFQLSKSIFPIGHMKKQEVRALAENIWLPNAKRKDSQWLCFIGNIPIKQFLLKYLPKKPWNIVDTTGKKVGTHDGAYFFTIGQRHGLQLPFKAYVIATDIKTNTVIVGEKDDKELFWTSIITTQRHWIDTHYPPPYPCTAKIRYRQTPQPCTIQNIPNELQDIFPKTTNYLIQFQEPQRAIAPGQILVAYQNEECLGSGVIAHKQEWQKFDKYQ